MHIGRRVQSTNTLSTPGSATCIDRRKLQFITTSESVGRQRKTTLQQLGLLANRHWLCPITELCIIWVTTKIAHPQKSNCNRNHIHTTSALPTLLKTSNPHLLNPPQFPISWYRIRSRIHLCMKRAGTQRKRAHGRHSKAAFLDESVEETKTWTALHEYWWFSSRRESDDEWLHRSLVEKDGMRISNLPIGNSQWVRHHKTHLNGGTVKKKKKIRRKWMCHGYGDHRKLPAECRLKHTRTKSICHILKV